MTDFRETKTRQVLEMTEKIPEKERIEECLDKTRFVRWLGDGRYGAVFEVIEIDGKSYAMKLQDMTPAHEDATAVSKAEFAREVVALEAAGAEGLSPRLFASGICTREKKELGWILMELLRGITFHSALLGKDRPALEGSKARSLLQELLVRIISYYRRTGWRHRDMHFANIYLSNQRLYLLDWGAAEKLKVGTPDRTLEEALITYAHPTKLEFSMLQWCYHHAGFRNEGIFDPPTSSIDITEQELKIWGSFGAWCDHYHLVNISTWRNRFAFVKRLFGAQGTMPVPEFMLQNGERVKAKEPFQVTLSFSFNEEKFVFNRVENAETLELIESRLMSHIQRWDDAKSALLVSGLFALERTLKPDERLSTTSDYRPSGEAFYEGLYKLENAEQARFDIRYVFGQKAFKDENGRERGLMETWELPQ